MGFKSTYVLDVRKSTYAPPTPRAARHAPPSINQALGLLCDGYVEMARGMVDNFVYQITHYHKILNANRSYYLTRSQPPFLTDMALQV